MSLNKQILTSLINKLCFRFKKKNVASETGCVRPTMHRHQCAPVAAAAAPDTTTVDNMIEIAILVYVIY